MSVGYRGGCGTSSIVCMSVGYRGGRGTSPIVCMSVSYRGGCGTSPIVCMSVGYRGGRGTSPIVCMFVGVLISPFVQYFTFEALPSDMLEVEVRDKFSATRPSISHFLGKALIPLHQFLRWRGTTYVHKPYHPSTLVKR